MASHGCTPPYLTTGHLTTCTLQHLGSPETSHPTQPRLLLFSSLPLPPLPSCSLIAPHSTLPNRTPTLIQVLCSHKSIPSLHFDSPSPHPSYCTSPNITLLTSTHLPNPTPLTSTLTTPLHIASHHFAPYMHLTHQTPSPIPLNPIPLTSLDPSGRTLSYP